MKNLNGLLCMTVLLACAGTQLHSMDIFEAAATGNVARIRELIDECSQTSRQQIDALHVGRKKSCQDFQTDNSLVEVLYNPGTAERIVHFLPTQDCLSLRLAAKTVAISPLLNEELIQRRVAALVNKKQHDQSVLLLAIEGDGGNILEAIQLLVAAGADVNGTGIQGTTPLISASCSSKLDIVSLLIKEGADVNQLNNHGQSPLFYAVAVGAPDVAEALLKAGAIPHGNGYNGLTPLHSAVNSYDKRLVQMLIDAGANPFLKDNSGKSPRELALENARKNIYNQVNARLARELAEMLERYEQQVRQTHATVGLGWHPSTGAGSSLELLDQSVLSWVLEMCK